jgi:transposase
MAGVFGGSQSAELHNHDPHAHLKDVMDKLPTRPNSHIDELLPQHLAPAGIRA